MALLRLIPLSSGRIVIDGIDISQIEVEEFRRRIIVASQDSLLMPGTLRFNMDPHGTIPDDVLIESLVQVGLGDRFDATGGLDSDLEDCSLSAGEAQLTTIARALVDKSRIVVLDEALSKFVSLLIGSTIAKTTNKSAQLGRRHGGRYRANYASSF